jgi:outer membrane lipoprotein SlyB
MLEMLSGGDCDMEVVSGTIYKMEQCIRAKLLAAGAISREKAVTIQEAHFDMQEQNWLNYIAGGLFANVKKTADKRYYIAA